MMALNSAKSSLLDLITKVSVAVLYKVALKSKPLSRILIKSY